LSANPVPIAKLRQHVRIDPKLHRFLWIFDAGAPALVLELRYHFRRQNFHGRLRFREIVLSIPDFHRVVPDQTLVWRHSV